MIFDVVYIDAGTTVYLDGMVKEVTVSGDLAKDARTCNISLNNTENGRTKRITFKQGREIRLLVDSREFFRGIIFKTDIDSEGDQSLTVYDYTVYLSKSSDHLKFTKKKASDILRTICAKYGIKTGRIDDTKYAIPKLIFQGKTLYDMIVIALTETRKATGKRYILKSVGGAIELHEVKAQTNPGFLEAGYNILSANYSESIEDRKTQVKLTGGDEDKPAEVVVKNAGSIRDYGVLQHYEHNNDVTDAKKLRSLAENLLRELNKTKQEFSVEALGSVGIVSGVLVKVSEPMTGLTGAFYVESDSHKFSADGTHTMSLTISRELELPEEEYQAPEEKAQAKAKATTVSSGSSSAGGGGDSGNAVVNLANSFKGKLRYVFGGKNVASGGADCSGFVAYVFKKARGINLGGGTSVQVTKGVKVAKSDAQPGDIVFFQGTYRAGVSHVGIVTRPGYCVSLADSGCKEHSYTSGYWGSHFMQIRRV